MFQSSLKLFTSGIIQMLKSQYLLKFYYLFSDSFRSTFRMYFKMENCLGNFLKLKYFFKQKTLDFYKLEMETFVQLKALNENCN